MCGRRPSIQQPHGRFVFQTNTSHADLTHALHNGAGVRIIPRYTIQTVGVSAIGGGKRAAWSLNPEMVQAAPST